MTDTDPIQEPAENKQEIPEELDTSQAAEASETVISAPKSKARSRKKPPPSEPKVPAEAEAEQEQAGIEPETSVPEEEPVATIASEPLPSTPPAPPKPKTGEAPPYVPPPPEPLSEKDERNYAMLAHLTILLNLVTGFLGPVAALVIYLIYKDRSRYVRYHAMQSFVFQLIWWLGAGILAAITWVVSIPLMIILVGCLLMPIALVLTLIPLAALVYGVIGAVQTNEGQDFRYWLIGDWVRGELTGE